MQLSINFDLTPHKGASDMPPAKGYTAGAPKMSDYLATVPYSAYDDPSAEAPCGGCPFAIECAEQRKACAAFAAFAAVGVSFTRDDADLPNEKRYEAMFPTEGVPVEENLARADREIEVIRERKAQEEAENGGGSE